MWFKNLQIYRLPAPWDMSAERLEEQLAKKPFHPCGSQDMESRGWLSPLGNEVLVHAVGGQFLICLGFEHRLLPSAVVKQEADERAEELAEQQGYKLGRKQMKELKRRILLHGPAQGACAHPCRTGLWRAHGGRVNTKAYCGDAQRDGFAMRREWGARLAQDQVAG